MFPQTATVRKGVFFFKLAIDTSAFKKGAFLHVQEQYLLDSFYGNCFSNARICDLCHCV